MKIQQLPEGARFEYEGEEYVKDGPMFATSRDGRRRMIPKYAVLKPLGAVAVAPPAKSDAVPRARVLAAFEEFSAACRRLLPPDHATVLDAARNRFLQALD